MTKQSIKRINAVDLIGTLSELSQMMSSLIAQYGPDGYFNVEGTQFISFYSMETDEEYANRVEDNKLIAQCGAIRKTND